jgi:hypothetical protein
MQTSTDMTISAGSFAEATGVDRRSCEHRLANAAGRPDPVDALAMGCAR